MWREKIDSLSVCVCEYGQCLMCDTRALFAYLTIILNASHNGTNFDIILKIVCWCLPCFSRKCSSLLSRFFPFAAVTAADCLRLLCVWHQVHRWKVCLVMWVCAHGQLFSCLDSSRAHSQFSLRYANHFDGIFVFFVYSYFSPNSDRLLCSCIVNCLSPTFEQIFFSSFRSLSACLMIFSRNLRNLVGVKVYPSIFAFKCRDFQFPWRWWIA